MLALLSTRIFGHKLQDVPAALADSASAALTRALPGTSPWNPEQHQEEESAEPESTIYRTVGWISAGLGAVALGLFVGRELRQRYKFNRRTPYDFYAHSGDEMNDVEFGVGV